MDSPVLFAEKQQFRQWWLWLLLLCVNGLMIYGYCKQVIGGVAFGSKPASNLGLAIGFLSTLLITIFVLSVSLDTQIKSDGIYVRFFPFRISYRRYGWEQISRAYIREYNPIMEYGGWGIRYGLFGRGRALNISGTKGLQLELTDGSKLLIGTQLPGELEAVLRRLGRLTV